MKNKTNGTSGVILVRRKPGRPGPLSSDKDQIRDRILDASEELFSQSDFAATSFRDIARQVQVNPALIGYYFGSKRALYNEVYKRRGKALTGRWMERLDELEANGRRSASVEQILRAFLEPQFELKSTPGGLAFIRLQTRVHSEVSEESFALRREVYDEGAKRFVAMLEQALPDVEAADISWRFIFCIGASLYMIAEVDRLSDVSSGRFHSTQTEEVIERLTAFCVAGTLAPTTPLLKKGLGKGAASKRLAARAAMKKNGRARPGSPH